MVDNFIKYSKIWIKTTEIASQLAFLSRFGAVLFVIGKLLRFVFFFFLIVIIASRTKAISGFSIWQMMLFYVSYSLVDLTAQFLLREVYRFRQQIVNGNFDYTLIKPMSPLFRSMLGGSDILDLFMILINFAFLLFTLNHLPAFKFVSFLIYFLLMINGLIIEFAFHIFTLSVGILTTEVDNTIMLFRDISSMGKYPVDIYREPLRGFITFAVPVGIMMTFPAKVLLGILNLEFVLAAFLIGGIFLFLSIKAWSFALSKYTSASS